MIPTEKKSDLFLRALNYNILHEFFEKKWYAGIEYAKLLTINPDKLSQQDIEQLRDLTFSDGEILEINQVVSYFNYANRTVLGLGVHTEGDILGLSPNNSDNSQNWTHQ